MPGSLASIFIAVIVLSQLQRLGLFKLVIALKLFAHMLCSNEEFCC